MTAGSDRGNLVWEVAVLGASAAVVLLTVVRLLQLAVRPEEQPAVAPRPAPETGARLSA